MQLQNLDWAIVVAFFIISILIGVITSKKAGKSSEDFFLSGRNMPWWLLGISMVATTFAADTPGLVTNIVREDGGGVFGNWVWWAMLLTGMLTVFFYARLWRKSGVTTDLEFYELRYSGKSASFLRGFRAIYLGVIFNIITMAGVCLAGIKIGQVLLGLEGWQTLLIAGTATAIYSMLGGLKSVLLTDFFQFIIAMIGSVWATVYIVNMPEVGGIDNLLASPELDGKMDMFPDFSNWEVLIPLFIIPIAVQWWSTWYPGAEPGGGGYIAQRMLAAKDEKHATWAVLFFNFAHYALRPWPWILLALASLVVYPSTLQQDESKVIVTQEAKEFLDDEVNEKTLVLLSDKLDMLSSDADTTNDGNVNRVLSLVENHPDSYQIKSLAYLYTQKSDSSKKDVNPLSLESLVNIHLSNPKVPVDKMGHDVAYSSMLTFLPIGLLGIVVTSLIAAFMSTISTQLNWGSSYIVNDFYKRFINKKATGKQEVQVGRLSTALLMIAAGFLSLYLEKAKEVFDLMLLIGAGTGLLFVLRWFWKRINPYSEIAAMVVSFGMALVFFVYNKTVDPSQRMAGHWQLVISVGITTLGWVLVSLLTSPTDEAKLKEFDQKIFEDENGKSEKFNNFGAKVLGFFVSVIGVYAALFGIGYLIYGDQRLSVVCLGIFAVCVLTLFRNREKLF